MTKKSNMLRLYGFRSCDMVRNAMKWLDAHGFTYEFVDYRRDELDPATVDDWFARAGWEHVFNRNATAFRELPDDAKAGINQETAKALILGNTNLIKRPVLDAGSVLLIGFKADVWGKTLGETG